MVLFVPESFIYKAQDDPKGETANVSRWYRGAVSLIQRSSLLSPWPAAQLARGSPRESCPWGVQGVYKNLGSIGCTKIDKYEVCWGRGGSLEKIIYFGSIGNFGAPDMESKHLKGHLWPRVTNEKCLWRFCLFLPCPPPRSVVTPRY